MNINAVLSGGNIEALREKYKSKKFLPRKIGAFSFDQDILKA